MPGGVLCLGPLLFQDEFIEREKNRPGNTRTEFRVMAMSTQREKVPNVSTADGWRILSLSPLGNISTREYQKWNFV